MPSAGGFFAEMPETLGVEQTPRSDQTLTDVLVGPHVIIDVLYC
jgi:hypothetical protein